MAYSTDALEKIATATGASGLGAKLGMGSAASGGAVVLGGVLAATLLIYGAYKTYQRFYSQAAKACQGKSFKEKTQCMKTYRIKAIQKQIQDLKTGLNACSKTKDPRKCSSTVSNKLYKLNKQLEKLVR